MKGTFTRIDLSNNLLSDEGLLVLVSELKDHTDLTEINIGKNKISDIGLLEAKELMDLPNLKTLYLFGNYGPSEKTIDKLVSSDSREERAALRKKIK